ncbi:MAG: nucleotidyltransferase domain-containing protein [Nitrospirae bacterium]|nr:nucleotidyltransferase domain-containing protein [Nitrospirota bacterium]
MDAIEKKVLNTFKGLLLKRGSLYKMILFGSRARGDAAPYSDMDVLVVLNEAPNEQDTDYISDCAWEAGFEHGIVVVPVVFSKDEWENSPERYSLLAKAVEMEGIPI